VWGNYTSFNSRIKTNSLAHTTMLLLKIVPVAGMGANVSISNHSLAQFFAFAALAWAGEALSELEVYLMVHSKKLNQYRRTIGGQFFVLLIPAIFYSVLSHVAFNEPDPDAASDTIYTLWVVFFCCGFTMSPTLWRILMARFLTRINVFTPWKRFEMGVPMNVNYIVERYGLFQIIVIGETVLSASAGFQNFVDNTFAQRFAAMASLGIAVQTKLLYYELQGEQKRHALRIDKMRGFGFMASHLFVFLFLVACGSLLHCVAGGHGWDYDQRSLFLISSGGFLCAMSVLSLCHEGIGKGLRLLPKEHRMTVRLTLAFVLLLVGALIAVLPNDLSNLGDCEAISLVMIVFAVDFSVEFYGSKFSKKKCGCSLLGETPCLQRIITQAASVAASSSNNNNNNNNNVSTTSTTTRVISITRQATVEMGNNNGFTPEEHQYPKKVSVIKETSEGSASQVTEDGALHSDFDDSLMDWRASGTPASSMDSIDKATLRTGGAPSLSSK
jgi:low temperature requirement protein LtrA